MIEDRRTRKEKVGGNPDQADQQSRRVAEGRGERGPEIPRASRAAATADREREPAVRPRRRRLSAERKFQIFLECCQAGAPVGEILRREGLYSSDLARIRAQVKEGALDRLRQRPGRKKLPLPPAEVERLVQELAETERALAALSVEYLALKKDGSRASRGR
jgi:transposase-like protein